MAKPFNPILGETFEMDRRDDFGYRYFAEQVSHHPPISACHCESDLYTYWAEAHVQNRFRGNTLEIEPRGQFHLTLHPSKEVRYPSRAPAPLSDGCVLMDAGPPRSTTTGGASRRACTI